MASRIVARPRAPQPPARGQLRLGLRRRLRAGLRADAGRPGPASRRAPRPPLHGAVAGLAARRATGLPGAPPNPRRPRPGGAAGGRLLRAGAGVAPRARPRGPAAEDGRRDRTDRREPAARRLARRAGLGAGSPDIPGDGGLRLDDPRRQPLPRRGDPRGAPVGAVHHRRPGPSPDGLRHREGPAIPDPLRRRRGRHRLPPPARHGGRATASGRWATTARSSARGPRRGTTAGARRAGSTASSRPSRRTRAGSRRSPRRTGWRATRRSGGSTCPPRPTPRWASGRCRPTRAASSASWSTARRPPGRPSTAT